MLGRALYHSTSIASLKLLSLFIFGILFANLNMQSAARSRFLDFVEKNELSETSIIYQLFSYHTTFPQEYIFFFIAVFIPIVYYGFVRGVTFFENGIRINKGLPFFNTTIHYNQIEKFELIHSRYFLSITQKDTGDDLLFSVNNVDRALAILDQNGIKGDLGIMAKKDSHAHLKLLLFFIVTGILMALIQYSDFIRLLFKDAAL